jgi:hypothetical protein
MQMYQYDNKIERTMGDAVIGKLSRHTFTVETNAKLTLCPPIKTKLVNT